MKRARRQSSRPRSQPRRPGHHRNPRATCVPPEVDNALRVMAVREGKSTAWIVAQIVYEYFGLDETGWYAKSELRRAGQGAQKLRIVR